jgi:hypothetical protein
MALLCRGLSYLYKFFVGWWIMDLAAIYMFHEVFLFLTSISDINALGCEYMAVNVCVVSQSEDGVDSNYECKFVRVCILHKTINVDAAFLVLSPMQSLATHRCL